MSVSQISLFLESKPGHFSRVLNLFQDKGINVRGFSASDTLDYGIVRIIVDKPQLAMDELSRLGAAAKITEVLCLKLEDSPGELSRVMGVLSQSGINVVYCYSLISTYIAVSVSDIQAAEQALSKQPVVLVSQDDFEQI